MGGALAAVDCGTNSTRLLVADASGTTLERLMRITRLGAGVDRTGRLATDAVERTLSTLREYRSVVDRLGVERIFASATSAARDAANAAEFLDAAGDVLGVRLEVLAGEQEGALSYRGATSGLDAADGPFLVVDVGGGSTELVTSGGGDGLTVVSLDVGCVRLTERFLHTDPPSLAERSEAAEYVASLVEQAADGRPGLAGACLMVGLAGTVSALAVLALGLPAYDRDLVHHARLGRAAVRGLLEELAGVPLAARLERPGMERARADVLVGGALVLVTVMEVLGHDEFLVSESDILDGMIAALLDAADSGPGR